MLSGTHESKRPFQRKLCSFVLNGRDSIWLGSVLIASGPIGTGSDITAVKEPLAHSTVVVTMRYAHTPKRRRTAQFLSY
jgi:hypothetical protein